MLRLVEFPLENGSSILVEVDVLDTEEGILKTSRNGEVITKAHKKFEEVMEKVKPAASVIIAKLRSLHDSPDEIEVQFGLKLSADAGAFVASAGIEANYAVTLRWKKEDRKLKTSKKSRLKK